MNPGLYGLPFGMNEIAASIYRWTAIASSGNFTAPQDGWYLVTAIGAGGSGARQINIGDVRSGAAGGFSQKKVWLQKGAVLACVIGAGGTIASGAGALAGNPGTATTVAGPGVNLTCNGGEGGSLTAVNSVGGAASGGDINIKGGDGIRAYGGSVPVYGIELAAGAEPIPIPYTLASSASVPAEDAPLDFLGGRILCPFGRPAPVSTTASLILVSGPGRRGMAGSTTVTASSGGMFAGGAEYADSGSGGYRSGNGGIGAGGGAALRSATSFTMYPGSGGNGLVVIEWLQNMEA